MRIGSNVFDGRVREEYYAESADVPLYLLKFSGIERVVPADVHEDPDAAIKLKEGLRGW